MENESLHKIATFALAKYSKGENPLPTLRRAYKMDFKYAIGDQYAQHGSMALGAPAQKDLVIVAVTRENDLENDRFGEVLCIRVVYYAKGDYYTADCYTREGGEEVYFNKCLPIE